MERIKKICMDKKTIRMKENEEIKVLEVGDENGFLGYMSLKGEKATINGITEIDTDVAIGMMRSFSSCFCKGKKEHFRQLYNALIEIIRPTGFFDEIAKDNGEGLFDYIEKKNEKGFFDRDE